MMKLARGFNAMIAGAMRATHVWPSFCVWLFCVSSSTCPAWCYEPIAVEFLWLTQPKLDFDWMPPTVYPRIEVTSDHIYALPVRERIEAAQSILRVPESSSLDRPEVLKALLAKLTGGEQHRLARIELLAAACELDDGKHAQQLWKIAQGDIDAEHVVQRACIRWRSPVPIESWRASLADTAATDQALLHAVDGLGAAGSSADTKLLTTIVLDGTRPAPLRLGGARAIGNLATEDQLQLAKQLRDSTADNAQLLAVEVLARSPAASTTEFIQEIALRGAPIAQRAAYRWLCLRDATTAQRLVGDFLKHPDADIRVLALNQITQADTHETLPILFAAFEDVHPKVRETARLHVLECCNRSDAQLQTALGLLSKAMESDEWRGLEQSIRLTVELKQNVFCERLVSLISHKRTEVCITASWALRHLAEDEAILLRMLSYVNQVREELLNPKTMDPMDIQAQCAAHLLEAFGHRKFEPAKDTVVKFVPKNGRLGLITRMTAIWACGKIWEHSENKALIRELHARIADKASMTPEPVSLRFAATIALGWIADGESREHLITWEEPKPTPIGFATEWALKRIDSRK